MKISKEYFISREASQANFNLEKRNINPAAISEGSVGAAGNS